MNNEEKHIVPIELLTKFFSGEANTEEIKLVENWKQASDANIKEFNAIQKLWNISEVASDKENIDVELEWDRMLNVIAPGKGRAIQLKRILQIAATILILLGFTFLGIKQTRVNRFKTTLAESKSIELPDGSRVTLNARSKLIYARDFGQTNREVTLKGEGFFEVAKNADIPFVVHAHEAQVEVIGTQFNVKAFKDQQEIKVTVTQGKVKLAEKKQPVKKTLLTAGETGTYDRELRAIKKKQVVDNNDMAWKTRVLRFETTPLSEVAEILKNTYHQDIIVSESVSNCRITVVFEKQELNAVLEVLKSTLDLNYRYEGKKLFITGEGC